MAGQHNRLDSSVWERVYNEHSEPVPPFGVMKSNGMDEDGYYLVTRPDGDSLTEVFVNGPLPIPAEEYGQGTRTEPCTCLIESAGHDPAQEDNYGTQSGSWKLHYNKTGFRVIGATDGNTAQMTFLGASYRELSNLAAPSFSGARVYYSDSIPLTNTLHYALTFDTVRFDTDAYWSAGEPTRLTIPESGYYLVGAHCQVIVDGDSFDGTVSFFLLVNSTTSTPEGGAEPDGTCIGDTNIAPNSGVADPPGNPHPEASLSSLWYFEEGDYVEAIFVVVGVTNLPMVISDQSAFSCEMWISRQRGAAGASGGDHGDLTGLGDDDHTQYALLAGRAGGQTLNGGTAASQNLQLSSTAHATKGFVLIADPAKLQNRVVLDGFDTAATLTADQNDYAIDTTSSVIRLSSDASRNITGIAKGGSDPDCWTVMLTNVGSNPIVLKAQNTGSAAANRFDLTSDITLNADESAVIWYDPVVTRWRVMALYSANPTDADYLVRTAHAGLSAERVVTDTATVTWDWATAAQAKANVPDDAITYAKLQNASATARVLARKTAGAGDYEECTFSEVLDFVGSAAQGDILYRNATAWVRLGAGTSGHFLKTQGAGANPTWDTAGSFTAATQAEMEAASSNTVSVTPGRTHFHPGTAKGWVHFNASSGSPVVGASYNVTSVSDNGTGLFTVNWGTDFSSSDYSCVGIAGTPGTTNGFVVEASGRAGGSFPFGTISQVGSLYDASHISIAAWGDHA